MLERLIYVVLAIIVIFALIYFLISLTPGAH